MKKQGEWTAPSWAKICLRCGGKAEFTFDGDMELHSSCCGWPPVDPSSAEDAREFRVVEWDEQE